MADMAGLMKLASSQFGLFSRKQAEKHGFTEEGIHWRLASKQWERFRRGVYRLRGINATWSQSAQGMLLQAGEGSALSHGTAAFLHGLDGFKRSAPQIIDLTATRERDWKDPHVRLHETRDEKIPSEVVRGLRATTLARTILDLTDVLKGEPLEQALDSARRIHPGFPNELDEYLESTGRRPGIVTIKKMIAERAPLDSAPEVTLFNEALRRGLPRPVPGLSVFHDGKFVAKVDLGWKEAQVAALYDSYLHHSARADFDRDARQRAKLQAADWSVVVVTKRTLGDREWSDAIKQLLQQAAHRLVPR